jgi:hypothetical protein
MSDVVAAAVRVQDLTGQLPTDILQAVLHRESETEAILEKGRAGKIDGTSIERWHEDGTFDKLEAEESIRGGVLQIIASQFVGQGPQKRAGESELRNGINEAFKAKQKAKQHRDAQRRPSTVKTTRKKGKHRRRVVGWDDAD